MAGDLHVVLGSTGGAGNAIARALLAAGHAVRAVNRTGRADLPAEARLMAADIRTPVGAGEAVAGADVVYLAAQPPYHRWPQEFPAMVAAVTAATAEAGAKLVMVDNLYAYGPGSSPMNESRPQRATDRKGALRARIADDLLAAHRSGTLRVTIGRASDYFGPRADNSGITALAIEPVEKRGRISWVGRLDVPHAAAYLPDIARAYVTLGTSDDADGQVWILPHAPAVTGEQFLALVNNAVPSPLRTGRVSLGMLRLAAPFHRISRETLGIAYQWTAPFEVDDSRFRTTFGPFEDTPLPEAVAAAVAWYAKRGR